MIFRLSLGEFLMNVEPEQAGWFIVYEMFWRSADWFAAELPLSRCRATFGLEKFRGYLIVQKFMSDFRGGARV